MRESKHRPPVRREGRIKWFNKKKGYGFIECDRVREDIFVHYSHVDKSARDERGYVILPHDQHVTFILREGPKGLWAKEVEVAK